MRHDTIYPPDFDDQRINEEGMDFRCQRGQHRHPKSDLHIEPYTNYRVCSFHLYSPNKTEVQLIFADASEEAARVTAEYARLLADDRARGLPVPNVFVGMQAITSFSPAAPQLVPAGGTVALALTGIGFVDADALAFDDPQVTATAPVITFGGTQLATTLAAGALAKPGLHTLRLNGYQTGIQAFVLAP